tara:strand:- start:4978 stop:5820 length:843 start_codon:yes stop_codon:yes gene_type:complete
MGIQLNGITGDAIIPGDVGIGGTLTYEDVTNIDSVGVITARDGLRVTGIATITGDLKIIQSAGTDAVLSINEGTTSNPLRFMQTATEAKIQNVASQPLNIRSQSGSGSTGYLAFWTRDSERLRINATGVSTFFGNVEINTTAASTSATLTIKGGEGAQGQINLIADEGDDGGDQWRISAMSGFSNRLIFFNAASGSHTDVVSFQTDGTVRPGTNNQASLGTASLRWSDVYTNDLHLSNQGTTNSVDNTWGDFTIQEGESDLFLINNRSGKKYKFNLTEVS